MTDIPLDTSPITTQFMLEKRRPDGTRPSWKDMPRAWAFDVPAEGAVPREQQRKAEPVPEPSVKDAPASQ